jgi:hypothetical protein
VTRPKGDLIFQKSGRRSTFLTQPHRQPLLFDVKYPLTSKNTPPILPTIKSNALSKPLFSVDIVDEQGTVVATVEKLLYVRRRTAP